MQKTFVVPVQKTKGHCSVCQKKFEKDEFSLDKYDQARYNGQPICRECKNLEDEFL